MCLCSKQIQTAFITKTFTGLPPCPPISACLLFKTWLGFESMAWCQGKICQFWFKYLFWRFKVMLTGSFLASKISPTVQLQAVGFALGFCSLGGRNGTDIWALNTDLRLHHKETTDLPRVHSFLTAQWEIKNNESQRSPLSIENCLNYYKFYFLTYFLHFRLLLFSLFSATLEHINKHIQYKSHVAESQHVKLKNIFLNC